LPSTSFQGHRVVFADRTLTAQLMTAHDAFREQLSPLDRRILATSKEPIDEAAMDTSLQMSALDWTEAEIGALASELRQAEQAAMSSGVVFRLPDTIYFAKESEAVYGGANYTRCAAVFMPGPESASILIHELFHVMSRYNPQIRAELYALVGYRPCHVPLSSLGADLADVVITNPDTDAFGESCITLPSAAGRAVTYVPLLIGEGEYDGTPFGWTSILVPILVEVDANRAVVIGGATQYREMVMADYIRAIGGNGVNEPFHPEELVAQNLEQALLPESPAPDFPNRQLVRAVQAALARR
jgi:hypothetical protein